ncbi:hypothetical protein D3C87_517810 [compost metagenome]
MPTVHMIRQKKTGLFSNGGSSPYFTNRGKMWTHAGALNSHLSLLNESRIKSAYKDCEIVSFELTQLATLDMDDMVRRMQQKEKLMKLHNDTTFASFIENLEKKDLLESFRWIVYVKLQAYTYADRKAKTKDLLDNIRGFKIKKADYRYSEFTFAFARKEDAAKFRLTIPGDTFTYDGTTFQVVEDK